MRFPLLSPLSPPGHLALPRFCCDAVLICRPSCRGSFPGPGSTASMGPVLGATCFPCHGLAPGSPTPSSLQRTPSLVGDSEPLLPCSVLNSGLQLSFAHSILDSLDPSNFLMFLASCYRVPDLTGCLSSPPCFILLPGLFSIFLTLPPPHFNYLLRAKHLVPASHCSPCAPRARHFRLLVPCLSSGLSYIVGALWASHMFHSVWFGVVLGGT